MAPFSTERVDHEAENPKPISGRLESSLVSRGRSSISTLRCPEVRLELNFEVSRGPIRIVTLISTLMCSWVGGVQRSDQNYDFEVSRGPIRIVNLISTLLCSQVGLGFDVSGCRGVISACGVQRSV